MSNQTQLYKPLKVSSLSLEVILLIAIGLGVLLRVVLLSQREFWYDEVLSLMIAAGNLTNYVNPIQSETPVLLSDYTALLSNSAIADQGFLQNFEIFLKSLWREPHPPLFFTSQYFWLLWFGNSVAAVRSLNALISIIAMASSYGLGQILLGRRGGLLFTALVALNPFFLFHSLNVRMYCPLVLWATLSSWALLELIQLRQGQLPVPRWQRWGWTLVLIFAVFCGFMTFYLFAYFILALGILTIFLERKQFWRYVFPLGTGVLLTLPWMAWGFTRQLTNVDLDRFSNNLTPGEMVLQYIQGLLEVLGYLFFGEWSTEVSLTFQIGAGIIVVAILLLCGIGLLRHKDYEILGTGLILGLLPLILLFASDVLSGKLTFSWGEGRSVIFALPGCLLLVTIWIERAANRWRVPAVLGLIGLYAVINIADYTLRPRDGMDQLAQVIPQDQSQPTLIAMNSNAWGHVMRLAYSIEPTAAVQLAARPTPEFLDDLKTQVQDYSRVIVLSANKPLWSSDPLTEAQQQQVDKTMQEAQMQRVTQQQLQGTSELDRFTMSLYER
jgi:uncharacterized membrane protein